MRKLLINDAGLVVNAIELAEDSVYEPPEGLTLIDGAGVIGDTYDPDTGTFTSPAQPEPPPVPRLLHKEDIYARLTDPELETCLAGKAQMPVRQRLRWDDAKDGLIDVTLPEVVDFFTACIGTERAAEVLS